VLLDGPDEVLDSLGLSGRVDGRYGGRMPEAPILATAPGPTPASPNPPPSGEPQVQADRIAPPPDDPALQKPPTGQLLLGTDKRNPVFAVYEDESGERLLVFYGFELIEIVKNDSADPACKLLLARLYNAQVKLSALCESFQVDPKTIRRWGRALLQGDPAELVRVLEGRSACHKLTPAVENFARLRWPDLLAERSYGAVGRLLLEIRSVFGVEISRSGLQGLIRVLKGGPAPEEPSLAEEDPPLEDLSSSLPSPEVGVGLAPQEIRETPVKSLEQAPAENAPNSAAQPTVEPGTPSGSNAHLVPFFLKDPAESLYWCDHAGVLVFATALATISGVSSTRQRILAQWMAALLLGAQNIEQTKYLNWEDLELILGETVRFPTPQREQLKALAADPGLLDKLWRFNQSSLGPAVGSHNYWVHFVLGFIFGAFTVGWFARWLFGLERGKLSVIKESSAGPFYKITGATSVVSSGETGRRVLQPAEGNLRQPCPLQDNDDP
jgi:hypothetical protein